MTQELILDDQLNFSVEQVNEMFAALVVELDLSMSELLTKHQQGDYVKTAEAMDVLLEFRNSLKGMMFET